MTERTDIPVTVPVHTEVLIDGCDDEDIVDADKDDNQRNSVTEDDYKVDTLFYKICWFCFILGVNFYNARSRNLRVLSMVIVAINTILNTYFIVYVGYLTYNRPFNTDTLAITLAGFTWTLQATLSTLFLAHWQSSGQACKMLKQIYDSNKGLGIHRHRQHLQIIIRYFRFVTFIIFVHNVILIVLNWNNFDLGFLSDEIPKMFGQNRRWFLIMQLSHMYTFICWSVALSVFTLFVYATNYEFMHFNDQVRQISCDEHIQSDEALCHYLLTLIKTHNRLTECVKSLDHMFHRFAFVMIATIIPTTVLAMFMLFRKSDNTYASRVFGLLFALPLICFCVCSFATLTNGPSRLHTTIYETKSALCANTLIWFPYRPNVYHTALAFVCHLDQTNLGVSIWGFAIVTKPLVLTTLSVMVTCFALFMQLGDCSGSRTN